MVKTTEGFKAAVIKGVYQTLWRGELGRWSASKLSHGLWLGYLAGGFVMILIMLSTRQYDFVWETTILSAPSFVAITEVLSWLPAKFGFLVPDHSQIEASRFGMDAGDAGLLRQAWAGLLLGCIILYGLVPRLLLLILSHLFYLRACNRYQLDLTEPYYVGLRNKLMPATRQFGIVDPDLKGRPEPGLKGSIQTDIRLPDDAVYLGIELNSDQPWPPAGVVSQRDLGRVDDREGQQRVLAELKNLAKKSSIVAVVPIRRSPDRGQARFLENLKSACHGEFYLGLSEAAPVTADQVFRQSDWYQLAAGIGIPADHIIRLEYMANREDSESRAQQAGGD